KYDQAQGWRRNDRVAPERTRVQARELAQRVAREAQQRPMDWDALVLRYSDGDDALRGGSIGVRSRSDMEHDFVLVELASRLAPGGVSDVVETMMGFHVLRRLPPRQPEALAASVITVLHAESQVARYDREPRRSRAEAEKLARELSADLARHPERFDVRRAASCEVFYCDEVATWYSGRMPASIELAIAALPVAGISREPVDAPQGLLVLRREDTSRFRPAPLPPPRFDIPMRFGPAPVAEPPNARQQGESSARSTGQ
ncbi:MAG TPA: peptidylprolyl isomerase, partial [Polyangiales bacterium]|nr:peptidylprolyl isomerase [Polyangiales bacterium]